MAESSRARHRQIDPVFKQILLEQLAPLAVTVQTEVEVSRMPRAIDALATIGAEELSRVHSETPFFYFQRHNQIEFKGRADPLTIADYHRIQGRTQLLLAEQSLSPQELTVSIVCAAKPRTVLSYAQSLHPMEPLQPGYYWQAGPPPLFLIVINELPTTEPNYPLLLFASSKRRFHDFLKQALSEQVTVYLRYAYQVRPQTTREVLTMAGISSTLTRADLEFIAEDIGEELITFLPPETRLRGLAPEERLEGLAPEERLEGLAPEERLEGLAPEERLEGLAPEERRAGLTLEEWLAGLTPEERKMLPDLLHKPSESSANDKDEC